MCIFPLVSFSHQNFSIKNCYLRTKTTTLYWSVSKEFFAKKKSLQRKGCKESKEKYSLKFNIFGTFCLENHHFLDIFPMTITFFKQFNNKTSVTEKSFSKNHKFHGICVTTLIHYYKIEINYVIFISKIFFAFSSFLCKEFKFFFASSQRMKSANI